MAKVYAGPKQLLPVAGKPLLEHALERLPSVIDELVIVIGGPYEQQIRDYFGSEHKGRKVTFVRQPEPIGLGHAIQQAKGVVRGRFLVAVPDDILSADDLTQLVAGTDLAALVQRRPDWHKFGVFVCDAEGCLVRAVEKPKEFVSDLASTGTYVLDEEFFDVTVPPSARGEIELPDIINALVTERKRRMKVVETSFWLAVNDPDQLKTANELLGQQSVSSPSPQLAT